MTVGLSALIAAAISAAVSVWGVARNIKHKAVTEEREKWRVSLRELVPELVSQRKQTARERARDAIVLRLNPYKDADVIAVIDQFVAAPSARGRLEVVACFQDMLKRDWERAKIEAGLWPWRARDRANGLVDEQQRCAQAPVMKSSDDEDLHRESGGNTSRTRRRAPEVL